MAMKILYTTIITLLLALAPSDSHPTFSLDCSDTLVGGTPSGMSSTLEVLADTVRWTQHTSTGDMPTSFTVTSVSGSWDTASSTGQLAYVLDHEGYPAELALTGSDQGITATFVFHLSEDRQQTYGLTVAGITYY